MTPHRWLALLLCGVACTSPPDVVAIQVNASTGGEASGGAGGEGSDDPSILPVTGSVDGRDPAALFDSGRLWIVAGGAGVTVKTSTDLATLEAAPPIFAELPAWVAGEVPDAQSFWSPELAHFGGLYHLYYAVSTLGSSRSCIGHATTEGLSVDSAWLDRGPVLCSKTGDDFNAIDPSILQAPDEQVWLAFGSYLSGIKLVRLDIGGAEPISEPIDIAARPNDGGALQAAALAEHQGFFYLFVSFDTDAAHRLVVGRANTIEGPYVDRAGRALLEGGGDQLLEPSDRFRGAGSNDIFSIGDRSFNIFHAYDEEDAGRTKLRLATVTWDADGWPASGGP